MAIPGYRILRKIRQGGMSTVYLAIQKSVEREVAIKVMSPSLSADPSFGSRFYREAKIVGQLSHPNIVSIYDVGSYKHYNYIAMDYLPGKPLQDLLDEGVGTDQAITIVRQMASALDYAHDRGYIHRDIKPDNILFRADGSAVLCDFGIAKALKGNIKMTNVGSVLGTPHYMSPEQAQGKDIDGRADLYSLGVVFFEMLTGQVPFGGDDPVAVAVKHMTSPIPKLPKEHKAFQPVIEQMMNKKANARFQTGREIIEALDKLESSIAAKPAGSLTQTSSTTVQVVGLAAAALSTLSSAISLWFKKLMLTKITFSSTTVQLSKKQLEDIDTFILNDNDEDEENLDIDDMALIQDTIEQPVVRYSFRWLYWPIGAVVLVAGLFIYFDEQHPEQLRESYNEVAAPEVTAADIEPAPIADTTAPASTETASNDPVVEPEPEAAEPTPEPTFALTIKTVPENASVRILNIKPRYTPGMSLTAGAYHIAVSAEDYFPQRQWVRIRNRDLVREIALEPTRKLLAAGTLLNDPLNSGGTAPTMVVLPLDELTVNESKTLSLSGPLAVSQHEITFDQYQQFVTATEASSPDDFGWGRGDRPVIGISQAEAEAYAKWLSEQTGYQYRLPSREEWEYAARAGEAASYWWGESSAANRANCRRGCKSTFSKLFGSTTAPVGQYEANAFGIYDSAGNVAEWLADCQQWQDDSQQSCISGQAAGGSHADRDREISSDSVKSVAADKGSKTIGIRLVVDLRS